MPQTSKIEGETDVGRGAGTPSLDRLLDLLAASPVPGADALALRRRAFQRVREVAGVRGGPLFVRPAKTHPVSVTGDFCALNCAHCGGKFLRGMLTLEEAVEAASSESPPKSWLLSGGCDARGGVPLPPESALSRLARVGRVNWHPGLASSEAMEKARQYVDCISFDFVGSDETIGRVLGLDARVEDYLATYRGLRDIAPVVPHLVVGLDGSRLRGEYRVLDLLASEGAESLVLLVLWPASDTAFENLSPPDLRDVFSVFATARTKLPRARLSLGCMRPPGAYRTAVDAMAAAVGFDVIVQPAGPVVREFPASGTYFDECCAFATITEGWDPSCA